MGFYAKTRFVTKKHVYCKDCGISVHNDCKDKLPPNCMPLIMPQATAIHPNMANKLEQMSVDDGGLAANTKKEGAVAGKNAKNTTNNTNAAASDPSANEAISGHFMYDENASD